MKVKLIAFLLTISCLMGNLQAQDKQAERKFRRHFIGSTAFIVMTPLLDPSPRYFQLNYGYRFTPKDVLSVEAITWTYQGPLGRPYGPDYEQPESDFPGEVRAYGVGLAYKRFLWKGAYAQIHSTAFHQDYLDEGDNKIQSGFQLFNTFRLGYHFDLFKGRMFIEPSLAATWWPINSNLPESFQREEDKWNKYFLFEPGLHFGFNF